MKEAKGRRVSLSDVPAGLWERCKVEAARAGMSVNEWVVEALVRGLEDAVDVRKGTEALAESGESVTWEELKRDLKATSRSSV